MAADDALVNTAHETGAPMLTPAPRAPLPHWLEQALRFDACALLRFCVGDRRIGWVRPEFARLLARWPRVFTVTPDAVAFADRLDSAAARSEAIAGVLQRLHEEGAVRGWRDECYRVPPRTGEPGSEPELFRMERAAHKLFGIESHASHLNGIVRTPAGPAMWIARRSADKAVDPGLLDNMVAGGIAADSDAWATLQKECGEEAGVPGALACRALRRGVLRFCRNHPEGADVQCIDLYDLELPADFVPQNRDGEVAEFRLLSPGELARELEQPGLFTVDAALVANDCRERLAQVR